MHIIHGLSTGGAETLVRDYLLLMQGPKIESRAVCFDRCGSPYETQLEEAGVHVTYLSDALPGWVKRLGPIGGVTRVLSRVLGTRKEIRAWRPDVVHTHLLINGVASFALGRKMRFGYSGKPLVLVHTVHSEPRVYWFPVHRSHVLRCKRALDFWFARQLIRRHRMRLVALHERMRQELDTLFGVSDTVVVNNGIDFMRFEHVRPREEVRRELGIPEGAFVVGHVGRLVEGKNHAKVISVFDEIHSKRPDAFLLLVGNGPLREAVERDLEFRGLADRCIVLSNRGDVPDLMGCMDVFLFPSLYEGLGIVLIEAQVSKLPCVISSEVPSHAIISNIVRVRELEEGDSAWADDVLAPFPGEVEYYDLEEWDMRNVVKRLESLYRGSDRNDERLTL